MINHFARVYYSIVEGPFISAPLSFRIEGKGHPLLLIHGWGVTYNVWQKLVPLLSPHFQLILVELPGVSGATRAIPDKHYYEHCAEALEEFRQALGIERWAMLAYSTGTRVGHAYLRRYSQRVTQAVFLCPMYITLPWMMTIRAGQWLNAKHAKLANWFVSDWRLYGWLLVVGFNLRGRDYVRAWMREIGQVPLDNLKRMLLELPGRGRAPFTLPDSPPVPTLFIWGKRDQLTALPTRPHPNDVFILANHGAPVLVPEAIAAVVVPFLEGEVASTQKKMARQNQKRLLHRASKRLSQDAQINAWPEL